MRPCHCHCFWLLASSIPNRSQEHLEVLIFHSVCVCLRILLSSDDTDTLFYLLTDCRKECTFCVGSLFQSRTINLRHFSKSVGYSNRLEGDLEWWWWLWWLHLKEDRHCSFTVGTLIGTSSVENANFIDGKQEQRKCVFIYCFSLQVLNWLNYTLVSRSILCVLGRNFFNHNSRTFHVLCSAFH